MPLENLECECTSDLHHEVFLLMSKRESGDHVTPPSSTKMQTFATTPTVTHELAKLDLIMDVGGGKECRLFLMQSESSQADPYSIIPQL